MTQSLATHSGTVLGRSSLSPHVNGIYITGGQVLDSDLPADDDDLLGHRGGRVVPPAHGDEAGGELGGVCREGEARDRQEGRTGRAPVGWEPEEEQGWIPYLQRKDNLKISVRDSFKLLLLSSHKLGGKDTDQIVKVSSISVIVISIGASFANTKIDNPIFSLPNFP